MPASARALPPQTRRVVVSEERLLQHMVTASKRWNSSFRHQELVAVQAFYSNINTPIHAGQTCFHTIRQLSTTDLELLCAWIMPHTCRYTSSLTPEEGISFLNYLANESPYQDAFLCKNGELMWELKTMAFDVNCAGNLMVGGMIAARAVYHGLPLVKTFLALVSGGMNKDLALFIASGCHFNTESGVLGFKIAACSSRGYTGHAHISPNTFDMQSFWNFLGHDPKFTTPPFILDTKYYGLHITFLGDKYRTDKEVPMASYGESGSKAVRFVEDKADRAMNYLSKLYKSGGTSTTSVHNIFSSIKVYTPEDEQKFESLATAVPKLVLAGEQVMKDFQLYKELHK